MTPQKRNMGTFSEEAAEIQSIVEKSMEEEVRPLFMSRPTGCKAAKKTQEQEKTKEGACYA